MPPSNFADRLVEAIRQKQTPAIVALDPVFEKLPAVLREHRDGRSRDGQLAAMVEFCGGVIHAIAPLVPAVKINSAYFEPYRGRGMDAFFATIAEARRHGLIVIGDVKRGDVQHTAEKYAESYLADLPELDAEGGAAPDAITINGYFGWDGVRPFLETAIRHGRGLFVLVRTSNQTAAAIQDVIGADGCKVHEIVAGQMAQWAKESGAIGTSGYSSLGAVVGTRRAEDAAKLRSIMPNSIFLVPGYGAQGGTAADMRPYFAADGSGAVIAAGRSVIYAFEREKAGKDDAEWQNCVETACLEFASDVGRVI